MESNMTNNIEKITGEIETLAAELAELAKEGREAEIAPRLSETKARWVKIALRDHELAKLNAFHADRWRCELLREHNMDLRTDEEIKDLVRAAKTRGLTFDAASSAVIGRFFDTFDDESGPSDIPDDHWRAHRVRLLAMEVYQLRQPAADKSEEERQREEATAQTLPCMDDLPW
jgi:hypothetical protein